MENLSSVDFNVHIIHAIIVVIKMYESEVINRIKVFFHFGKYVIEIFIQINVLS